MITYRKTRQSEWVAFGDPAGIQAMHYVHITRRDGQTDTRLIRSVGKTFQTPDGPRCYGYLEPLGSGTAQVVGGGSGRGARTCDECGERRATTTATDLSGITGMVCGICARSGALSFA